MTADLAPYPAYRDTDSLWLGCVPSAWQVSRLKGVTRNVIEQIDADCVRGPRLALEDVESWTGRTRRRDDPEFVSSLKRFDAGDVLFGKLRPYLAKVARAESPGGCVGEFLVLRPRSEDLDSEYLAVLLRSAPFIHYVNSSTFGAKMPRAEWSFIGNARIPAPPLAEQRQVALFTRHADRRINRLIRATRRLIELLNEQKQAIINHAVTRGLDPKRPTQAVRHRLARRRAGALGCSTK